jgi:hypothetical protein
MAKVGCMLKSFDFKESISWCAIIFDSKNIMIQIVVDGRNLVMLTPNVFRRML